MLDDGHVRQLTIVVPGPLFNPATAQYAAAIVTNGCLPRRNAITGIVENNIKTIAL